MSARKTFDNAWSEDEISILRTVMPVYGAARVSKLTGRTHSAVIAKCDRLGLKRCRRGKRPDGRALTDRIATALVAAGAAGLGVADIERIAGGAPAKTLSTTISRMTCAGTAFGVGFRAGRRYFSEEASAAAWDRCGRPLKYEERLAQERAARKAARKADQAAKALAPRERKKQRNAWTEEEIATLRLIYPNGGAKAAAQALGRTVMAVTARAITLGVKCLVCVQYIGHVKAPAQPKVSRPPKVIAQPKARPLAKPAQPRLVKPAPMLRPSPAKPVRERGPADFDGPLIFTAATKYTFIPTPPLPLRTNTHSVY